MPAQLLALNDGPSILVDKPILLLGRHPECDIQIDSRKISRRHCCIAQVNDYLVVRDLDSTNGVRINGNRVSEGRLDAGDELAVGSLRYRVTWDERVVPPAAVGAAPGIKVRLTAPAPVRPPEEDDLLESCDEPIALPEPGRADRRDDPFLRPKKLDLLSSSGSFQVPNGPPPG